MRKKMKAVLNVRCVVVELMPHACCFAMVSSSVGVGVGVRLGVFLCRVYAL